MTRVNIDNIRDTLGEVDTPVNSLVIVKVGSSKHSQRDVNKSRLFLDRAPDPWLTPYLYLPGRYRVGRRVRQINIYE